MSESEPAVSDELPETVEVEILYTYGAYKRGVEVDRESDGWLAAQDFQTFGTEAFEKFDHDPEDAVETAFVSLGGGELATGGFERMTELLESVYQRCQGPNVCDSLPYEGRTHRSMSKGDIVVVDGEYFMAESIGFEQIDV